MRNTILAVIGLLWGGAMIASALAKGILMPTGPYGAGGLVAFLLGILLFAAGGRTLLLRRRRSF